MQSEDPPAIESTSLGVPPVEVVARCRVCGKSPDLVEFSKSQKKRLKKGLIATCKACSKPAGSSGSASPNPDVGTRPSLDAGANAITGTESSKAPMVSVQVIQGWLGRRNALVHVCVGFAGHCLVCACTSSQRCIFTYNSIAAPHEYET